MTRDDSTFARNHGTPILTKQTSVSSRYGANNQEEGIKHAVDSNKPLESNSKEKITNYRDLLIMVILFLFVFGTVLLLILSNNVFIEKSCNRAYNSSSEICKNLTAFPSEEGLVQKSAKSAGLNAMMIYSFVSIVTSIPIVGWSDKYGRKIPLLIALFGCALSMVFGLVNVINMDLPLEYLYICYALNSVFGSFPVVESCAHSYVCDKFSVQHRTSIFAFLHLAMIVGQLLGTFLSGQVNYVQAVSIALSAEVLAFFLTIIFIKDVHFSKESTLQVMVKDLFNLKILKEFWKTCAAPRENNGRLQIFFLVFSFFSFQICFVAPMDILLYYCKKMYSWSYTEYANSMFLTMLLPIVVVSVFVPILTRCCAFSDAALGMVGSISLMLQNIVFGLSFKPWIFFIAIVCGCCSHFVAFGFRSHLSKIVNGGEIGKILGLSAATGSLAAFVESLSSTVVYNLTIDIFPGAIFFVYAILVVFSLSTFIWILNLERRRKKNLLQEKALQDNF